MDLEKRAKLQSLRVIISETIMVIAVIITVVVLALVVSGYWLNSDFEVERQGMLQIYSIPTGASVAVDGDAPWFQRTNTSKVLSSGEHTITLTKDGYDSWSKTVSISEGLLYRLHYPQLFLQNRKEEVIYDATATTFATVSPNRKLILLANRTTNWTLLNLDADNPRPTTIDVSKVFSAVSMASGASSGLFTGEILSAEWDQANEHILFNIGADSGSEWALLNVKQPADSINLTREFASNFSSIKIFDNSANNLLAVRNGNLHKINVGSRQISAVLIEKIGNYDFYESEIIYISDGQIILTKLNDESPSILGEASSDSARILLGKFYDNNYIFVVGDETLSVYQKENFSEVFTTKLEFAPEQVKIGYHGMFVSLNSGNRFATLDMESMTMRNWNTDSAYFGWLSSYMLYSVNDGKLCVYDFDGLNRRELATNVSGRFPAAITNNKWLYYFSDDAIIREKISD